MHQVNITTAKANLSALIRKVEDTNEEIIIERMGYKVAKIIKYQQKQSCKRIGIFENQIEVAKDFDHWPDDIAISLGLKDQ